MTENEMKNRISFALKDPILQQGFEIICKNLADLKKENAELKADNDARKFAMAMSEKVEKQLRNERNTFLAQNEQYEKDLIGFNEQLTKAKEIIKQLLDCLKQDTNDPQTNYYVCKYMDKAEQFLKEIKEK